MNSLPSLKTIGTVTSTSAKEIAMDVFAWRITNLHGPSYMRCMRRLTGCCSSGWYLPTAIDDAIFDIQLGRNLNGSALANIILMAGSSVIASSAAMAIARFLEYAKGLNSRPSWSTSVNIGIKLTATTSRLKNTLGPTSNSAARRVSKKVPGLPEEIQISIFLYAFSTSTMAPSTSTPIEMAMPARLIRFAFCPISSMGMKARATETGIVMMGIIALGMCHKKTNMTMDTMIISSISLLVTVLMDDLINWLLS